MRGVVNHHHSPDTVWTNLFSWCWKHCHRGFAAPNVLSSWIADFVVKYVTSKHNLQRKCVLSAASSFRRFRVCCSNCHSVCAEWGVKFPEYLQYHFWSSSKVVIEGMQNEMLTLWRSIGYYRVCLEYSKYVPLSVHGMRCNVSRIF